MDFGSGETLSFFCQFIKGFGYSYGKALLSSRSELV